MDNDCFCHRCRSIPFLDTLVTIQDGFIYHQCGKRGDCTLCMHSEASTLITIYKKDSSLEQLEIKKRVTCTDESLVYIILCTKQNGTCAKVHPQYVGDGEDQKVEVCQTN